MSDDNLSGIYRRGKEREEEQDLHDFDGSTHLP